MENELVVLVIEKGIITEVYSCNANQKIVIVDNDCKNIGESFITEFRWPEIQYDDERVRELLGLPPGEEG